MKLGMVDGADMSGQNFQLSWMVLYWSNAKIISKSTYEVSNQVSVSQLETTQVMGIREMGPLHKAEVVKRKI